jgi:hypothetical protein
MPEQPRSERREQNLMAALFTDKARRPIVSNNAVR